MKKKLLLFILLSANTIAIFGQAIFTSQQDGNWDNTAVWDQGAVPDNNDTVIIATGDTISMNGDRTCAKLTIRSAGLLTGGGSDSLTVTGNIDADGTVENVKGLLLQGDSISGEGTLQSDTRIYIDGNKIIGSEDTVNFHSTVEYTGSDTIFNYGYDTITGDLRGFDNNSVWVNKDGSRLNIKGELFFNSGVLDASADYNAVDYYGNAQAVKDPINSTYHRLVLSGTDNPTLQEDVYINGNFRIDCDTLKCNTDSIFFQGDGYAIYGDGVVDDYAAFRITGSKIVESWTNSLRITDDVQYTGTNDTIYNEGYITIGGSIIGNSSSYWENETGAWLNINDSLFGNNGHLIASANNNVVNYTGIDQDIKIPESSYYHLTLSGSGNHQMRGNLNINGDLSINTDTLTTNDYNIILADDWYSSALFIPGTGSVTLDGGGQQQIDNTGGENFYNFEINKSGGTVTTDDHITISDTLTLAGANIETSDTIELGVSTANPGVLQYSSGYIIGKMERWINATGTEYYFPIGIRENARPLLATYNTLPSGGSVIAEFRDEEYDTSGIGSLEENGYCFQPAYSGFKVHDKTRLITRQDNTSDWTLDGDFQTPTNDTVKRSNVSAVPAQFTIADTLPCDDPGVAPVPTAHDTAICGPDSVTVEVSGSTGNYLWYENPNTDKYIAKTSSITTPYLNEKDTVRYYVSAYYKDTTWNSLTFDGDDDYAPIKNYNYSGTDYYEVTVEAWIKTTESSDQIIASYDRSEYWRLEIGGSGGSSGELAWDLMTDDGILDFGSGAIINDGTWHHVAATYDSGDVAVYVDGTLVNSTSQGNKFGTGVTRYGFLGTGSEASSFDGDDGPNNYFNGRIDEFRVWDTALSQSQIQNNMDMSYTGDENHLVIYYNMQRDRGSSTLIDLAHSSDDAILRNMDTSSTGYWVFNNDNGLNTDDYDLRVDVNDYGSSNWNTDGPPISDSRTSESQRDTLTALSDSIPDNFLANNNLGCSSDSVILDATQQYNSYLWNDGSTNDSLIVKSSGTYWCEVTDDNCTGRDSITVTIIPPISTQDSAVCGSDSVALTVEGGTGMYRWYDSYPDGTVLDDDSVYVTPYLTDTATYYVVSYDTVSINSTVLAFDGTDDYVAIDDYYNGTDYTEVTVEAWIKTSESSDQIIASYDRNEYWRLEIGGAGGGSGELAWDVSTDAGETDFSSNTRVDDDKWHHVAAVYDSGFVGIYIDGTLANSTNMGSTFGSGEASYGFLSVGSEASVFDGSKGPTSYFNGKIDEFRVWDRALTKSDINLYKDRTLNGTEQGLRVYYPMNDGAGHDTVTDYADSHTGTLRNMDIDTQWQKDSLFLSDTWCEGNVDSATAFINPIPSVFLGADTCVSDSVTLDAGGTASSTYTWQDGSTDQTYTADTTGTYYVTRNDGGPCNGSDTINVNVVYTPHGHDSSRCGPGTVTLRASGKSPDFAWYDQSSGGTLLGTGEFYTTQSLSDTTPYYVASYDTNTCTVDTTALDFDGTNDYVSLDMNYSQQGEIETMTFEAWIKTSYSGGGLADNWAFIDFDRSEYYNVYAHGDGRLSFSTTDNAGNIHDMNCDSIVNDGQWHHIAAVYDGTDKILYIDGKEACRSANPHNGDPLGTGTTRYGFIGDGSEASDFNGGRNAFYYNGQVDEVRIWDTIRSAEKLQSYKNKYLFGTEPHLLAYYRMDDGPGSDTLTDHSENGRFGVLQNMDNIASWVGTGYDLRSACESSRDTAIAYVNPVPPVDLGPDTCATDSVTLDAGSGFTEYEWNDGPDQQTYTADTTGTYWVRVNDGGPCDGYDTVNVTIVYNPEVPDSSRCGPGPVSLTAENLSTPLNWYDSAVGGDLVASGDTLYDTISSTQTYYPASYSPDSTSYAINFDGNDDYVAIEDFYYDGSNYTEVTVEAWIQTADGDNQYIASYDRSEYWRLEINGSAGGTGTINWEVYTDNGQIDFGGNTRIDDGNWHHVAAVYDNGTVIIYVDGSVDASTSYGSQFGTGVTRYGLLCRNSEAETFDGDYFDSPPLNGNMTEFRVWSTARSKSEIQDYMYRGLTGGEAGIEIYYPMSDSTGSDTITDYAASNDGVLRNMDPSTDWNTNGPLIETYSCESVRDTATVTLHPLPDASISPDPAVDTICEGDTTELDLSFLSGTKPYEFIYSDGTETDTIVPVNNDTSFFPAHQPVYQDGVSDTTYYTIPKIIDSLNCVGTNLDTTSVIILRRPVTGNQYYIPEDFDE